MRKIYVLYAVSGVVALGYQMCWLRHFVDRFGSSTFTFALVICCFIGGLGLGSLASEKTMEWLERKFPQAGGLVLYGWVELAIAAAACLIFLERLLPVDAAGAFPYVLDDGIWEPSLAHQLARAPLAAACVALPCFLMGLTFPYLCRQFPDRPRFPSTLYAWNTVGASAAVLLCEFFLFLRFGTSATLYFVLALNVALGLVFALGGRAMASSMPKDPVARDLSGREVRQTAGQDWSPAGGLAAMLVGASCSGFISGGLEADAFRRLHFAQVYNGAAMAFVSFWAIAAIFAASTLVDRFRRLRLWHIQVLYFVAVAIHLAIVYGPLMKFERWVQDFSSATPDRFALDPNGTLQVLAICFGVVGLLTFPTYACISVLLPYLCNAMHGQKRHLGLVYGVNTMAFLVGMLVFSWIAPQVNTFYAYRLWIVTFVTGALVTAMLSRPRKQLLLLSASAVPVLICAAFALPRGFERGVFPKDHRLRNASIRALKGGTGFSSFVASFPEGDSIFLDTGMMSGTSIAAKRYMKLMIHFPLLAQADPKRALLICFGVGNSAAAIAKHESIQAIDIVDLSRNILETAPEFALHNDRVFEDPRVRMIHDDGRSFLELTDQQFNLVTSEPPPPLMHGIHRLYSRDYYEDVLEHLTPDGCMTQWLPVYQMPPQAARMIVRAFVDVFPSTLLITGYEDEFLLVGSRQTLDFELMARRFGLVPAVRSDLADIFIPSAEHMLATLVMDDAGLRALAADAATIEDELNPLAIYWPTGVVQEFPYDPLAVQKALPPALLDSMPRLRSAYGNLHELRRLAPNFPGASLAHAKNVVGSQVPWREIRPLNRTAEGAFTLGAAQQGFEAIDRSLKLLPEQLDTILAAGWVLMSAKQPGRAIPWFERSAKEYPEYQAGHYALAVALARTNRLDDAVAAALRAVSINPRYVDANILAAQILLGQGKRLEARRHALAADAARPKDPNITQLLGRIGT